MRHLMGRLRDRVRGRQCGQEVLGDRSHHGDLLGAEVLEDAALVARTSHLHYECSLALRVMWCDKRLFSQPSYSLSSATRR